MDTLTIIQIIFRRNAALCGSKISYFGVRWWTFKCHVVKLTVSLLITQSAINKYK